MKQTQEGPAVERDALIAHLDALLEADLGEDFCPNGLQVQGRARIRRIITGVSACRELFSAARQRDADAVMVHHGIFWNKDPRPLVGLQFRRVRELIEGELNLIAYHLPLDRHAELGNNALAARRFGLVDLEGFAPFAGQPTGFRGRFVEPITAAELGRRTAEVYAREPLFFDDGPASVSTLAIVSGGSQRDFFRAIDAGLDAFITGEVSEWVMNVAREARVHYLAAGHYATERLGIRALGEHVAEHFGIAVEYVDIPNPV